MTFQGYVGRRQSKTEILMNVWNSKFRKQERFLYICHFGIDRFTCTYILVPRLIKFLSEKSFKFFKHLNLLHTTFLMTAILSIELIILLFMLWPESLKTGLNVLNAMLIDKNNRQLGKPSTCNYSLVVCVKQHRLGSLINEAGFRGCLYSNYTKWFTSGFQIRQGMQQNIIPVPTSKLPFKA